MGFTTFVSKAESIAANAVAEFSNIQLKLNGFLRNKIEKQDGRKLMALALRELIVILYVCVESFHTKKKKKKAGQKKMNSTLEKQRGLITYNWIFHISLKWLRQNHLGIC